MVSILAPELPEARCLRLVARSAAPTPALMSAVLEAACPGLSAGRDARSRQLRQWFENRAWSAIAFGLIDWRLPDWQMRRLAQDDGEWWCALDPRQPVYWDGDVVDECHPDMVLAVIAAFLKARCVAAAPPAHRLPAAETDGASWAVLP